MAVTEGFIKSVEDDRIVFAYQQQSACDSCRLKSGCGQKLLLGDSSKMSEIAVECASNGWRVDQPASLYVPDVAITFGVLLGYVMPIVALLLAALIGEAITQSEWGAIAFGALGLLASVVFVRAVSEKHKTKTWMQPKLINEEVASCKQ